MEDTAGVVRCSFLHEHKSRASQISCLAIGFNSAVFIGTTDGQLEEHKQIPDNEGAHRLLLLARKHIAQSLAGLILIEPSNRIAVLADGAVLLLNSETLEHQLVLAKQGATAFALRPLQQTHAGPSNQIAVATRTGRRNVRIVVFELFSTLGSSSPVVARSDRVHPQLAAVQNMVWVDNRIVLCTTLGYTLFAPEGGTCTPIFTVQELSFSRSLVHSLNNSSHALLLVDRIGIIIDASGEPIAAALTFPAPPSAIAATSNLCLAVCTQAVYAYDISSAELLQVLAFPESQRSLDGQHLQSAHNVNTSSIIIAGLRKVWLYEPVPVEERIKQLLHDGAMTSALELIGKHQGEAWALIASAEAALMLISGGRIEEALDIISGNRDALQAWELFPLFPEVTRPWMHQQPQRQYWDLHPPMTSLREVLVLSRAIEAGSSMEERWIDERQAEAESAIATYLLKVRHSQDIQAAEGVDTLLMYLLSRQHMTSELETLAEQPNKIQLDVAREQLSAHGQYHALALLYASSNRAIDAKLVRSVSHTSKERIMCCVSQLLCDPCQSSEQVVLRNLPWVLRTSIDKGIQVLKTRSIAHADALDIVRKSGGAATRQYLEYLIWNLNSLNSAHHTELALLLLDEILNIQQFEACRVRPLENSETVYHKANNFEELRERFSRVLLESEYYDKDKVRERLLHTDMYEEQVILQEKIGDHTAALQILALTMRDIDRAIAFCKRVGTKDGFLLLMSLLLHPPEDQVPQLFSACQLLVTTGADLDPMSILNAIGEEMPLGNGTVILSHILCNRLSQRRQGLINRNLHKYIHLTTAAEKAEAVSKHVLMTSDRACHACHTRLGNKMFALSPSGCLECLKCAHRMYAI